MIILCTITGAWLLWEILTGDAILLFLSLPVSVQVYVGIFLALGVLGIPFVLLIIGDFADWHFAKWAVVIANKINEIVNKIIVKMKGLK